jgi:hypothetical protein
MKRQSRPSFLKILAYYCPAPVIERGIAIRRLNRYPLPSPWTHWTPSLIIGPLTDLFVIGVGWYFLFPLGMVHTKGENLGNQLFLSIPWVVVCAGIYLFLRELYIIRVLWKAYKLGIFDKGMPMRVEL